MTNEERDEIHTLALRMEQYHSDVRLMVEQLGFMRRDVDNHDAVLYGIAGDDKSPGLLVQIQSLVQSRKALMLSLQAVWALLMLLLGSVFHRFFGQ